MTYTKVPNFSGLATLSIGIIVGVTLLILSKMLGHGDLFFSLFQAIPFLFGTVIIWYCSHPLSHYLSARALGVRTLFFYIGRSEMRNAGIRFVRAISPLMITLGTKLDGSTLNSPLVSRRGRAFIYGAGAIVSSCLVALIFLYCALAGYRTLTVAITALFLAFSVASEIGLSTKNGDLAKMKRALSSQ
jgi:hypothetical protein